MNSSAQNGNSQTLRFGVFDVDLRTQELRKHGTRLKLPRQSFQILHMLLERPGELVSREELQKTLWPADTFVDFDHGLNNAVKRIRAAIGDSAETPHWIETLPRLGYRFIGAVEAPKNGHAPEAAILPIPVDGIAVLPVLTSTGQHRRSRWWIPGIAVLALVAFAAGVYYRSRHRWIETNTLQISPFTSYPGYEVAPTFSSDGNQIAFSWTGGDQSELFDLYVKVIGTDTPVQLTHNPANLLTPAWAPDGRFMAFSRFNVTSPEDTGIFVIPAVGGPERKLIALDFGKHAKQGGLAWSADSKWLIYPEAQQSEFNSQLIALNVDSLERKPIPKPDSHCASAGLPAVSPDGKFLAFVCMFDFGLGEIFIEPWPSGEAHELLKVKGAFEGLSWAADGRSLVYTLGNNLWRVPVWGDAPERLWFGQDAFSGVVARAGSRLAFTQQQVAADIWRLPIGDTRDGSARAIRVAPSELVQQNAQYSPDGKHVAFESTRSGTQEVWVCNLDGSNLQKLTSFGGPLTGTPNWSPDGRHIVFDSRASGKADLYIVNFDGGSPQLLPTLDTGGSVPFWSHDGKWIYFASDLQGIPQLFKIPAAGGAPVQLTRHGGFIAREHPDGKRLYYVRFTSRGEIWSVGTDGTGEARVEGLPEFAWPTWDVTQNGIYYYDASSSGKEISFFDFATRRSRIAAHTPGRTLSFMGSLSISPDGKEIVYTQMGHRKADIQLVDNFR